VSAGKAALTGSRRYYCYVDLTAMDSQLQNQTLAVDSSFLSQSEIAEDSRG
jgi:hypothetical protein